MTLLTIEDKILKNFAIIEPHSRKIIWISGALSSMFVDKILKGKVQIREEKLDSSGKQLIMYLRDVNENDSDFPEALRQTFERYGFVAQLVGIEAAELQMILRHSPLSRAVQNKIIYNLPRILNTEVRQILTELRSA